MMIVKVLSDGERTEVAAVLREVADRVERTDVREGCVVDKGGNKIGLYFTLRSYEGGGKASGDKGRGGAA